MCHTNIPNEFLTPLWALKGNIISTKSTEMKQKPNAFPLKVIYQAPLPNRASNIYLLSQSSPLLFCHFKLPPSTFYLEGKTRGMDQYTGMMTPCQGSMGARMHWELTQVQQLLVAGLWHKASAFASCTSGPFDPMGTCLIESVSRSLPKDWLVTTWVDSDVH